MNTSQSPAPDSVLDGLDPGDEVLRRFRYQAGYAAIVALGMLAENASFCEVFCEHHEDILARYHDGTFCGIQIKTQQDGRTPFKSGDEQVTNSIRRFVNHEVKFPGFFSRYMLVSNCGLWIERRNSSNLDHLLGLARSTEDGLPSGSDANLKRFLAQVVKKTDGTAPDALRVLKKLEVQKGPSLDDFERRVCRVLSMLEDWRGQRCLDVAAAASGLVDAVLLASSRTYDTITRDYLGLLADPKAALSTAIIEAKRLTGDKLVEILGRSKAPEGLLASEKPVCWPSATTQFRNMDLKMAAGGLSAMNVDLSRELMNSVERLGLEWMHKYGSERALRQFDHIKLLVRSECQEAYDQAMAPSVEFGPVMLDDVRRRLRQRHAGERDQLFGCHYEHLLGVAGVLTEECKVWWSLPFPLPAEECSQ